MEKESHFRLTGSQNNEGKSQNQQLMMMLPKSIELQDDSLARPQKFPNKKLFDSWNHTGNKCTQVT